MKLKQFSVKSVISVCLLGLVAFSSNAALITVNGQEVGVYDINANSSATGFVDFYNYEDDVNNTEGNLPYSSNTGFEVANEIIMMLTSFRDAFGQQEFGLMAFISGASGAAGSLSVEHPGSAILNRFLDDPDEENNGGSFGDTFVNWNYSANRGDGLVLFGIFGEDWDVDLQFSNLSESMNDTVTVLSFDGATQLTSIVFDSDEALTFQSVNAPATVLLFTIAGFAMLRIKRKS
ncbi:MAG: hypothetical protein ABNH21_10305 [Glaciecola sp.]